MNGYVTFVNDNKKYIDLTDILVESILEFSKYDIEIFSINYKYNHSSNRVHNRIINLDIVNYDTICYSKLYSTFNSMFDYGVQLDADMIITKEADNLFEDCIKIKNTPLGSLHPHDPNNQQNIMEFLNVKEKTQPYVHATYLFSNSCKLFLEECYKISQELLKLKIRPSNLDETIYNVMLWKYGSVDYVDCYDPMYDVFLAHDAKEFGGYRDMKKINYYICHGQKNYNDAKVIFNKIKENINYEDSK